MNDVTREDMEFAAKAAGLITRTGKDGTWICEADGSPIRQWCPRDDDGDSFRLAVACKIDVVFSGGDEVYAGDSHYQLFEWHAGDHCAATRLAIFRAAVKIGRAMP